MPGDRDDEICQKALELLSDLCSKGDVQNENCLDFIYYFRDLARPRYSDSGETAFARLFQRMHGSSAEWTHVWLLSLTATKHTMASGFYQLPTLLKGMEAIL